MRAEGLFSTFLCLPSEQVAVTILLAAVGQGAMALRETADFLVPCQQSVTADHHSGEEASKVHVTVSETCTRAVYQTQAYHATITQIETGAGEHYAGNHRRWSAARTHGQDRGNVSNERERSNSSKSNFARNIVN